MTDLNTTAPTAEQLQQSWDTDSRWATVERTYTAEDVANRPGWSQIEAVRDGNIVTVDADIASRWGPRLPQLVELVADAMNSVAAPVGR